jgi:outer membrane receptor protein involved in Fe transport
LIVSPFDKWEFYVSAGRGFHSNDFRSVPGGGDFLTPIKAAEVGLRAVPIEGLTTTVTFFHMELNSELTYDAEEGSTSAGRPSKRDGLEVNATYQPFDWLEIFGSLAVSHSRYSDNDPVGSFVPDAPKATGNLSIYVRDLGPWFGGLEFRYIGEHPLTEDNLKKSSGNQEWNLNIGYKFDDSLSAQLAVFNVFDSDDNAADFFYSDRLPGEPAVGVEDIHIHPLEPRAFRLTVAKTF